MTDVKFRATVKHDGAEVGDLPWREEFWAVRYDDYAALQARVAKLEARSKEAVETLRVGFKSCDPTKQAAAIILVIAQLEGHGE